MWIKKRTGGGVSLVLGNGNRQEKTVISLEKAIVNSHPLSMALTH
jgi:hypothetical protein